MKKIVEKTVDLFESILSIVVAVVVGEGEEEEEEVFPRLSLGFLSLISVTHVCCVLSFACISDGTQG